LLIQLFGTPNQVEMAKRFASEFAQNQSASLDALLFDLRDSLRAELQLEPFESQITHLRIDRTQDHNAFNRTRG
jgi:hypothetical protein